MWKKSNKFKKNFKKEKRKKKKQKKETGTKGKTPQNCKSPMLRQMFITKIKNVTKYTHIHIHR